MLSKKLILRPPRCLLRTLQNNSITFVSTLIVIELPRMHTEPFSDDILLTLSRRRHAQGPYDDESDLTVRLARGIRDSC